MIKVLIILFFVSSVSHAKETILLIFNTKGLTGVTSQIILKGIRAGYNVQSSEFKKQIDLKEINIEETIEDVTHKIEKEIGRKRPIAIIGALSSNQAFLINIVSKKYSIPFVTPFATHPEVTKQNSYAFRTCFDDYFQAKKLSEFIYLNQKLKRGLVFYNSKQSYSIGIKNTLTQRFNDFSETEISSLAFSSFEESKGMLDKFVKDKKPEFIVLPSYQTEAATIFTYLTDRFKSIKIYGPDSWGGGRLFHSVLEQNPNKVEGFYVQHWYPNEKSLIHKIFSNEIMKDVFFKNNKSIAMLAPAAMGFDSLLMISHSLKSFKGISSEILAKNLKQVRFLGVSGVIDMNNSQTPDKELYIYKINNEGDEFYATYK